MTFGADANTRKGNLSREAAINFLQPSCPRLLLGRARTALLSCQFRALLRIDGSFKPSVALGVKTPGA